MPRIRKKRWHITDSGGTQIATNTPSWFLRRPYPISDDRIIRGVIETNEYRLPDKFDPYDSILDIGGHVGSFALACWQRGAKIVHSYEPSPENYGLLEHNALRMGTRPFHAAITEVAGTVDYVKIGDGADMAGGKTVPGHSIRSVSLEYAIRFLAWVSPKGRICFCKIDAEGAEWDIIPNAKRLDLIDEICIEYHGERDPVELTFPLVKAGFETELQAINPTMGLIFARRTQFSF